MSLAALSSAFAPNSIAVGVVVDSREAAIVGAGELLVASGRTTAGYTAEMLAVLNELGPYFVIAPGIAIAHAGKQKGFLECLPSEAVINDFGSHLLNSCFDLVNEKENYRCIRPDKKWRSLDCGNEVLKC
mgnify:CR=1 FL=1